jgi:hypothetical protein
MGHWLADVILQGDSECFQIDKFIYPWLSCVSIKNKVTEQNSNGDKFKTKK